MSADIIDLRPGSRVEPPHTDDPVLEFYGRWVKARCELRTVEAGSEGLEYGPESAKAEDAIAVANETLYEIERQMAAAPSHSVASIIAKLRVAAFEVLRSKSEDGRAIEDDLLLSAVADIMGKPDPTARG